MSEKNPGGFITANPALYNTQSTGMVASNLGGTNPAFGNALPGVFSVDQAQYYNSNKFLPLYDPYFGSTGLLLHGNGTNGAKNNTFLDSSTNNFTITAVGNATQGTLASFNQPAGYWSMYLDGASAFTAPTALQTSFAGWGGRTRSFECWVYRRSSDDRSFQNAYAAVAANGRWYMGIYSNALLWGWTDSPSSQQSVSTTLTIPVGRWVFISVCVDSTVITRSTVYLGINGVVQAFSGIDLSTQTSTFGWNPMFDTAAYCAAPYYGYLSNVRWSSNLRYTKNYTVPTTPLTSDANTLMLFGGTTTFTDLSATANPITVSAGTPSIQPFRPFATTAQYSPTVNGGSGYFDGSTAYLTVPNNTALELTGGPFSIEAWVYPTSVSPSSQLIIGKRDTNGGTSYAMSYYLQIRAGGVFEFATYGAGGSNATTLSSASGLIQPNAWNHVAVTGDGTSISTFVNGARAVGPTTATLNTSSSLVYLGNFPVDNPWFTGYITGARIIKGTQIYSGATYTVPTAPPTAITNTQLLINFTNAGIFDSASKNNVTLFSSTQISTAQSKFGGSSISFNGTTDYLSVRSSPIFNVGNSNFTLEFWIYPLNFSGTQLPFYSTFAGAKTDVFAFQINASSGSTALYASTGSPWDIINGATFGTLTANAWNHVAIVRNGTDFRGYVNGVQSASLATNTSSLGAMDGFTVGQSGASSFYFPGYMNDIRFTRYARYTASFIPPTSKFQDQ